MGKIFALSGPSGVGKTTFLNELLNNKFQPKIRIIPRHTSRPRRKGEINGFEYNFITHNEMLNKVFANDFIHFEKWGDFYFALETSAIEEIIESENDGIILAGAFGSSRLRATYKDNVVPIYMWPDEPQTLQCRDCIHPISNAIMELKWRIRKKLIDDGFSEFETASLDNDEFLEKRMIDNYLDIAAAYGKIHSNEGFEILANIHDKLTDSIDAFEKLRESIRHTTFCISNGREGSKFQSL